MKIAEIIKWLSAERIECSFWGDEQCEVTGFSSLGQYVDGTITWIKSSDKYEEFLKNASSNRMFTCAVVQNGVDISEGNQIVCDNSKEAFFSILEHFYGNKPIRGTVGKGTVISEEAVIDSSASVGCNCSIMGNVIVGKNSVIENNVTIQGRVRIGNDCIIHSGAVIGGDGFGYYFLDDGTIGKVEHYGGVIIEDHVEIGCNTCVDRGTIDDTFIGRNAKIDNLVHIAHNVRIKENACVVAGAIVCGSAELQENSYVAPGGIVKNQVLVGKNALVGLGAVVTNDIDESMVVAGIPAKNIRKVRKEDK